MTINDEMENAIIEREIELGPLDAQELHDLECELPPKRKLDVEYLQALGLILSGAPYISILSEHLTKLF